MDTGMRGLVQTRRRSVCGGEAPDALDLSVSKVMGVAGRGLSGVPSMKMTSMSTRNAVFPGRDSHLHGASPLSAHWPAVSPMQSPQSRRDRLRHGGKNGFQASPRQFNVAERELEGQVHGTSLIKLPAGVSAMSNGLLDGADAFKHKPGTRWPERGRAESKSMVALLAGALAKAKGSIRLDPARANKDESKAGLPERPWSWHPKGGIKSSFKGQGHRPSDGTHTVANKTRDAVCASEAGSDGGASECLSGRRQRGGEMLKDRNEQALKRPGEEGKTRPMFSARRYRKVGEREAGALAGCNEGKRADGNAMGRRDDEVVHKDVQSLQKDLAQTRVGSGAKAVASLEGDRRQASSQRSESEEGRATRTCPRGRASTASTASTESTSHAASGSPTSAVSGASSPEGDAGWVRAVQQQELEQQGQVLSIEERISSCNPPPACRHVEIVCDKDGRARGERDKGDAANCGEEEEEEEEEEEAHASLEALDSPKSKRGRGKVVRGKKKESVYLGFCSNTSLLLIRELLDKWGWRQVDKQSESRFVWMDPSHANKLHLLTDICKRQRVNFLPGMKDVCNKKPLYRRLNRAKKMLDDPHLFFFPRTYVLPEDYEELDEALACKKPKTFICKPDGGAQGAGIFLLRTGHDHKLQSGDKYIVQRYIHKPFLLDGFKFDLRLYVLVTSVDPLRCYLFNDGLARFCTQRYAAPSSKNMEQVYMHLTNYSLNKFNKTGFIKSSENGEENSSKRSVQTVMEQIRALGHDTNAIWRDMETLCLRTLAVKWPHLWYTYHATVVNEEGPSMGFQIIGVDVMFDHQLRPFLLETNNGPSFNMDQDVDRDIKLVLVEQALSMVKTLYRQPLSSPAPAPQAPMTETEILSLRRRRWDAHVKAEAWEEKCLAQEEESSRFIPLQDTNLTSLFPMMRPEVTEAFEMAARLGDRDRLGLRPLNPPKLATALKLLGILDGKRVTRAAVDLLYIEIMKDPHSRNEKEGMTLDLFARALHALAVRLYPGSKNGADAVNQMLQHCAPAQTKFGSPGVAS